MSSHDSHLPALIPVTSMEALPLPEVAAIEVAAVEAVVPSELVAIVGDPQEALVVSRAEEYRATFGNPENIPWELWVQLPGHSVPNIASLHGKKDSVRDITGDSFTFYSVKDDGAKQQYGGSFIGSMKPGAVWALDRASLAEKLELAKAQQDAKKTFVANHPLGEGALIVTNRYGGIDPSDPQATSRSILMRILSADSRVGSERIITPSDFVSFGLLDPRTSAIIAPEWAEMRRALDPVVQTLKQLPEGTLPEARSAISGLAQSHVEAFIEKTADKLWLAALMLKNASQASFVLNHLIDVDPAFKAAAQQTIENHRKR